MITDDCFRFDALKSFEKISTHKQRKNHHSDEWWFSWQREKDSNPHKQSQSLSCYPYTIPLCPPDEVVRRKNMTDYSRYSENVKAYF